MSSDLPTSGQPPDGTPPPVPPPGAGGGSPAGTPSPGSQPAGTPSPEDPANGTGEEGGAGRRRPFLLRLSPDLMEELKRWSAQEFRSINAHIEYLLREAVKKRKGGGTSRTRTKESL